MEKLKGKRVAVLLTHGVEHSEFEQPVHRLKEEGATVEVVAPETGMVKTWDQKNWGEDIPVDKSVEEVKGSDYDALILPGGVMNPDKLRMDQNAIRFTASFLESRKPVATICHGPWTLIETGMLKGRRMTSYPSLRTDLENAGVHWEDKEVVVDAGLVTSRNPADLPAFCQKMVEEIAEGAHV